MGLNIIELPYLIFRLAPIIIVSFFVLESLLSLDLRGILYLCGLILTCIISVFISGGLSLLNLQSNGTEEVVRLAQENKEKENEEKEDVLRPRRQNNRCKTITLGENGEYYSKLIPLNIVVYTFTFFYLLIFVLNSANIKSTTVGILSPKDLTKKKIDEALLQNVPLLVIFPLLIIVEIYWIIINYCLNNDLGLVFCLLAVILGGAGGVGWAVAITALGVPTLQYITSGNSNICSRPSRTTFRCKPKKM